MMDNTRLSQSLNDTWQALEHLRLEVENELNAERFSGNRGSRLDMALTDTLDGIYNAMDGVTRAQLSLQEGSQ
jgi:hypothetical protein